MTYREADPDSAAQAEQQLAAEEDVERAAADGREARAQNERGIEKRLLRERRPGLAAGLLTYGAAMGASLAAIGAGFALPIAVAAAVGAGGATLLGSTGLRRLQLRRENAWIASRAFPVMGYVEVLRHTDVITALTAKITLESSDPDDRARLVDLLGKVDTVEPVVTVEGDTLVVEMLVAGSVKKLARGLIDDVVTPLHQLRRVRLLYLTASTAPHSSYGFNR